MTRSPLIPLSLLTLLLLAGCSSQPALPDFTASGYLADRGAVRIWRKNDGNESSHLLTYYTPFSGGATETTDYMWQSDKLISIERHRFGDSPENVTLRFDQDGSLSFMQRQFAGRREALSADAVALYQFDGGRMLKISDDLLKGRVLLRQGRWSASGVVTTCKGQKERPGFDHYSVNYITQHQRSPDKPVSIAWLEAPKGVQLLIVTPDDLCANEPDEASF